MALAQSIVQSLEEALAGLPTSGLWAPETITTLPSWVDSAEIIRGTWLHVGDVVTCQGQLGFVSNSNLVTGPIVFAPPVPSYWSGEKMLGCVVSPNEDAFLAEVRGVGEKLRLEVASPVGVSGYEVGFTIQYLVSAVP